MSLTNKTLSGFFWAFLERFGTQALQMVIFIVLARILAPEAFGLIGMLAVFIAVSQAITDSGFGQALIQKKDTDEIDYSSVFCINLAVHIVIFLLLYTAALYISFFYHEPELEMFTRILGVRFINSEFFAAATGLWFLFLLVWLQNRYTHVMLRTKGRYGIS